MNVPLITPELVCLDADLGSTKAEVITSVAGIIAAAGRADADGLAHDALGRETQSPTGMPGGFAIPHCRSAAVSQPSLGFARLSPAVDFNGPDGPADLVFMIAAAEGAGADHMKLLTKLARALVKPEFVDQLRQAADAQTVVDLIESVVEPDTAAPSSAAVSPASAAVSPASATPDPTVQVPSQTAGTEADQQQVSGAEGTQADTTDQTHVVAVTACPTGIAHTYMAADYLTTAGRKMGIDVKVEPQGSTGTEPLSAADIERADAVIFATDVGVKGRDRFAGKPVIESGVKRAVNEPEKMVAEAVAAARDPHAHRVSVSTGEHDEAEQAGSQIGWGKRLQQALMTGVSYMIPFVAAGGLLIALGFLFGGYEIAQDGMDIALHNTFANLPAPTGHALGGSAAMTYLGAVFFAVGQAAFAFLLPALAGYIGFGLADRPGIAPGFVAGAIAGVTGAGFIGAIIGGLLGGFIAYGFTRLNPPRWLRGLMPVVIIPLVGSLLAGGLMYVVLGRPLAAMTNSLNNWLGGMSGASAVILGIILGLMMCSDLGGADQQGCLPLRDDQPRRHQRRIAQGHGRRHGCRNGALVGDGAVHRSASEALPAGRAGERNRCLAAGRLLHLRGSHPLRRSRSVARHPLDDGRRCRHRCPLHGSGVPPPRHPTAESSCSSPSTGSGRSSWPSSSVPSCPPCSSPFSRRRPSTRPPSARTRQPLPPESLHTP